LISFSRFINELRRRKVFRSGAAYVVIAWLLIQVADILLGTFAAPAWAMRVVVVALAVGFPVVLMLAWLYEITTQGVKRTEQVSEGESIPAHTGRKTDFVIIGVLIVAVALFAVERFRWIDFGIDPSTDIRSIAVLPLDNLSGDPEQEYFVDGPSVCHAIQRQRRALAGNCAKVERRRGRGRLSTAYRRSGQDHRAIDRGRNRRTPVGR